MKRISVLFILFMTTTSICVASLNAAPSENAKKPASNWDNFLASFGQKNKQNAKRKPALANAADPQSVSQKQTSQEGKKEKDKQSGPAGAVSSSKTVSAAEVNEQIQSIIKMNESLKATHAARISQLHSIQEQAKFHQQILKDLETVKPAAPVINPSDVDEVLRQEKIRLIREQTIRNTELVKALEKRRS